MPKDFLSFMTARRNCIELGAKSYCSSIAYHNHYTNIISGGLQNGQICIWDVNRASEPSIIAEQSHQGYVSCLQWSHKNNFEMLSGSSNGEVHWWDIRKMPSPLFYFKIESLESNKKNISGEQSNPNAADNISLDLSDILVQNPNACTAIDFDKTHCKVIRIGAGDGRVIFAHRVNNTLEKMYDVHCHDSSVSTVEQNWYAFKSVLTIDSSDVKVWMDDMKSDPIFTMSSIENEFSCGSWSLTR